MLLKSFGNSKPIRVSSSVLPVFSSTSVRVSDFVLRSLILFQYISLLGEIFEHLEVYDALLNSQMLMAILWQRQAYSILAVREL